VAGGRLRPRVRRQPRENAGRELRGGGALIHNKPHVDWFALAPVLSMLGATALLLLVAVLVPRRVRKPTAAIVCAVGFAVAFAFACALDARSPNGQAIVADSMFRDRWAALAQVFVAGCGLVAVFLSYREPMRSEYQAEYYALLAAAGAGMAFFVSAANLMTLFLGIEWFSIALYVLCAIDIDLVGSLEAGLKYLIVGAVGAATLLFGSALVYGVTGELAFDRIADAGHTHDAMLVVGLAMIITGLGFKASAAPFHMWTPDAYQGAPTPVTAFMASATKVAALAVTYRVLVTAFPHEDRLWTWAIAIIATVSLAWGNIAALVQRNVKRILAYSSVSHAGFMLIAVAAANELGAKALMYYLIPYCAMSLGAFGVVAARERELGMPVTLDNLAGFGWERPFFGVAMWTFMLGMLGFPLTGGFIGKFYVFAAAYEHDGFWWLIVVGVIATMISAYYYLGVVRAMYFRESAELQLAPAGGAPAREALLGIGVLVCLVVTVGSFFAVQPLIDVAQSAARSLPL
jgi:NADH-quinone oxidoreductase subunit N